MLKGKTAFITGTNRGVGKAILIEFAKNHANIIAHARHATPEFENMIVELSQQYNVNIISCYFDLDNYEEMKSAIRNIIKSKKPINILINSAAVAHGGLFQMTPIEKIRNIFNINFFAHLELTQLLLRYIIKNGNGSIVNIASVLGIDLPSGSCAYGVSKATLIAFTKTLAAECGSLGVRVNAVAPGLTDTEMGALMKQKAKESMLENCAMRRLGRPEEIAQIVTFLSSDQASFVNGQTIRIDGGTK